MLCLVAEKTRQGRKTKFEHFSSLEDSKDKKQENIEVTTKKHKQKTQWKLDRNNNVPWLNSLSKFQNANNKSIHHNKAQTFNILLTSSSFTKTIQNIQTNPNLWTTCELSFKHNCFSFSLVSNFSFLGVSVYYWIISKTIDANNTQAQVFVQ